MKRFELWDYDRETESLEGILSEAYTEPASVKLALNKIQDYWNKNPEKMLKDGTYPMLGPSFSAFKRGGVMIIGINPGMGGSWLSNVDTYVRQVAKNKMPPVFDYKTKTWIEVNSQVDPTNRGSRPIGRKKNPRQKKSFRYGSANSASSPYDLKGEHGSDLNWSPTENHPKRPEFVSKRGKGLYHAAFNKMMEDIGLKNFTVGACHTNFIPLPSSDINNLKITSELRELSLNWILQLIKVVKPRMIVMANTTYKEMVRGSGSALFKSDKGSITVPISLGSKSKAKGSEYTRDFYKTTVFGKTPTIVLSHWSSPRTGGPTNPTWQDPFKRAVIQADITRLYNGNVTSEEEIKKIAADGYWERIRDYLQDPDEDYALTDKQVDQFASRLSKEDGIDILTRMMPPNEATPEVALQGFEHLIPDEKPVRISNYRDATVFSTDPVPDFKNNEKETISRRRTRRANTSSATLPVETTKEVKANKDDRISDFETAKGSRIKELGSKQAKEYKQDKKDLTFDQLRDKWATPGKLGKV